MVPDSVYSPTCTVGYDGTELYALPRCARALTARYNLVDLSRRSPSYEYRLYKYSKRGVRSDHSKERGR